jgi:putative ABC transport system permease protein
MTRLAARLGLLLLPRRFRQRHRVELLRLVDDLQREPGHRGLRADLRLSREVLSDLAATGRRLRAGERTASRAARAVPHVHPFPSRPRRQVEATLHDVRQSLRLLAARPGYALPAVLTLALGIGGASLVGGLIDGLVLRPFALPDAGRLVSVGVTFPRVSDRERFIEAISPLEAQDIAALRSLERVMAFDLGNRNISGGDVPERVFTALVLGDPFPTLGLSPIVGRGFTREELRPGGPRAAVISHRTWVSRFGGDPAIVGRAIAVNGQPTTVVGVMPAGLLLVGTDLWLPTGATPDAWPRTGRQFTVLARLAQGVSVDETNAELAALAARTAADHGRTVKEYEGWRLAARPWAEVLTDRMRPAARLLAAAIACVLLFVCANVSSLQIARLSTRHRELAVRMALGASRWRLARELLTESLVLALAGGALGLALAAWGLHASLALLPAQLTTLGVQPSFSPRVLLWGMAISLLSAAAIAILPAMLLCRIASGEALKSDSRSATAGRRPHRLRQGLVVVEVAAALVLLVGAGLMAHSLDALQRRDPGVATRNVLTMRLTLPAEKYQGGAITAFFSDLVTRLEATPGVAGAAAASQFPPAVFSSMRFQLTGAAQPPQTLPNADFTIVTPGALEVLGIPLREGRPLLAADRAGAPRVVVVNESFARRYYPGRSAVGQRIAAGDGPEPTWWEIVGVVGDTLGRGTAGEPEPGMYLTMEQDPMAWNQLFLLIRTRGSPAAMMPTVRRIIADIDPQQPVYAIQTLDDAFAASTLQHRASTILLLVFAGLAVVLAAVGVYAVTAQTVAARRVEIGIRMALGAAGWDVSRMIAGQALRLIVTGAVLGLAGGVALGRVASSLLVGTSPTDPAVLASVTAMLVACGLTAGWIPARRASRIDPASALHEE